MRRSNNAARQPWTKYMTSRRSKVAEIPTAWMLSCYLIIFLLSGGRERDYHRVRRSKAPQGFHAHVFRVYHVGLQTLKYSAWCVASSGTWATVEYKSNRVRNTCMLLVHSTSTHYFQHGVCVLHKSCACRVVTAAGNPVPPLPLCLAPYLAVTTGIYLRLGW